MSNKKIRILMVCLGNICRSPTAEAVFREEVRRLGLDRHIEIDSAGTGTWHVGEAPDSRAIEYAALRKVDLSALRARTVHADDFHAFDYIFAMDEANLHHLLGMKPGQTRAETGLFLTFPDEHVGHRGFREVPDPYYSGQEGFELVLDLVEDASKLIVAYLAEKHRLPLKNPADADS